MATIYWLGRVQKRPQVDTITCTASAVNGTFTATINGKDIIVTHSSTSTTTGATEIYTALAASTEPEFAELTFANATATTVTVTGPDDGAPFTMTKADAGGSTSTLTTTTAPKSPHDYNDGENWSGGSVPGNDTAVWDKGDVDTKYNLSALSAQTTSITRRRTYTGSIGLPDTNPAGYLEYRARYLATAGLTLVIEQAPDDNAAQIRIDTTTAGAAVTATVTGSSVGGTVGSEAIDLTGFPAASVLNVSGASVTASPLQGQAGVVATLLAIDAVIRIGPGATLTTATLVNTDALIRVGYTTLNLDRGGNVEVIGTGTATTTRTEGGTIVWRSSGTPGAVIVGTDGTFDASEAPVAFTVTSMTLVGKDWSLLDPGGKITTPAIDFTRCGPQDGTIDLGSHFKLTKGAHS